MTSPRPHDLLRPSTAATDLLSDDAPTWAREALRANPWVVVRRASAPDGLIPVGVRGRERSHRYACTVRRDDVLETVAPEDLTDVHSAAARRVGAMRALSAVRAPLNEAGLAWGPTGSVGFELATGEPTATPDSDLDLVIRAPCLTPDVLTRLATLHRDFGELGVRVDCQVETRLGAIALGELLSASVEVLVKTALGPRLLERAVAVVSLAFLFPGQGSQRPDMLHDLPDSPAVAAVVEESRSRLERLGFPEDVDSAAALQDTINVQIALLIAGVACARALIEDHGLTPQFVAGHSVGAFAAAVTVGAMGLADALTAVELRGRLMNEACAGGNWGMAALTGLPIRSARQLVEQTSSDDEPLWLANINSATQTVLGGAGTALQKASHVARTAGATDYERLDVSVASHCPLQAGTAQRLAAHLAGLPPRTPTAHYLTNTGGRAVTTARAILDDLAQSVAHPVQWYDATRVMPELGATCAIETHPGHVLTRLCAANAPGLTALSVQDNGVTAVVARARQLNGETA